jgi:hypothetical protein
MTVRDVGLEPQATWRPSAQWCHVGLGPGLVDEDQTLRVDPVLIFDPLCPSPGFGLCPPIRPGATLPVSRTRHTQLMAVLTPTPNRAAAWWQDMPPASTAATTRLRRSTE